MRSTDTIFVALLALASSLAIGCKRDEDKAEPDTKTSAGAEAQPGQQADQAVGTPPGGQAMAGQLTDDGRQFLLLTAEEGLLMVEAARLAQTKAQTEPVREFARMMIDYHTRSNEELRTLAQGVGLAVPQALDANAHKKLDMLRTETGREFDEEYMDLMVDEHQRVIGMFEQQSERQQDAPVRGWASQTLPTLRSHLDQAKTAEDRIDEVPATAPTQPPAGAQPGAAGAQPGAAGTGAMGGTKEPEAGEPRAPSPGGR